ncbi:LuxR C-terminal-related transcriptional regulator [Paenibacillus sp. P36]|uniref:helix-turn-helix transcriptional regulator n=1 Tax=Paenibacillus sp. P36 TaxID=3342538 RepID=UPI0038B3435D
MAEINGRLVVGRQRELQMFNAFLQRTHPEKRLLNLYGTGGIGKSFLLDEFRQLAAERNVQVISLDSRDIVHTPSSLCHHVVQLLERLVGRHVSVSTPDQPISTIECIKILNRAATEHRLLLTFDTYEEMGELDHWLREHLIKELHPSICMVISGRYALQGAWKLSSSWRQCTVQMPLSDLSFSDVKTYLHNLSILDEHTIYWIWNQTKGHPLTLSLTAQTSSLRELIHLQEVEVLPLITKQWLKEVSQPALRRMVEAASVLKHFNQETLAHVLEEPVTAEQFQLLTELSFVRRVKRGWLLHDLVRTAFSQELSARSPDYYATLRRKCMMYYYHRTIRSIGKNDDISLEASDFFHYFGDELILQFFNQDAASNYFEVMDEANFADAERYIQRRYEEAQAYRIPYVDSATNQTGEFVITREQNLFNLKHVHLRELAGLGPGTVRLLRKPQGEVVGLTAVIPINSSTIDYLLNKPLSSAYFRSLPQEQLDEFALPSETPVGYYIQTIDVLNYDDMSLLADTGHFFITLLLTGGFVAGSPPPIPFSTEIHHRLGCEMSPVVHYDYDQVTPTHTFTTDTRGHKLQAYLRKMMLKLGMTEFMESEPAAEPPFVPLTDIQRKISDLLMQGMTNAEIAKQLFLSEITIKKHLTAIFQKLEVRNRTQAVQKLISSRKGAV